MLTHDIWSTFRDHFQSLDHLLLPGVPLPVDDPTLLFVSAGMVPFKPCFLGDVEPPAPRIVSLQKCVRTTDIDAVGVTMRYNTFFQMAGSFSFGDYFKAEAITYAWELLGKLGVDPDRIWVTVFSDDDEAYGLWRRIAGLPPDRIQRLGRADNLWNMGVPGPCGPSSEIFFDRGPQYGPDGGPAVDTDRFMEIWNLVFMTDIRGDGDGDDYPILAPLPSRNVDTGMGLERTAVVLQGVDTVYETDLVRPILDRMSQISTRRYGIDREDDVRMRIVADHTRSAVMLVADGVTPATDGRGYVLRRLLRRAMRSIRLLGVHEPVLGDLITDVRDLMAPSYPSLVGDFPRIDRVIRTEEETFRSTLAAGSRIFDLAASRSSGVLSGSDAFLLHDTYGFPIDLTLEMSAEAGLTVDEPAFRALMDSQRTRARRSRKTEIGSGSAYRSLPATSFIGYEQLSADTSVTALVRDGALVPDASPGDIVEVFLDRTPFYPESGGQASDAGRLTGSGLTLDVLDVQKLPGDRWMHRVRVLDGIVTPGTPVEAAVDQDWRLGARQAHSGTHVLHAALRQVLGPSALQSGSSNRPGRLRLDFAWPDALSPATLGEVEMVANRAVRQDLPVTVSHMPLSKATALGALALFGEAYGNDVRVVEIGGDWSRELCGGTHVTGSAQIGPIAIVAESSVGSGVRRIDARVGIEAFMHLTTERDLVTRLTGLLAVPAADLPRRIESLIEALRGSQRQIEALRSARLSSLASSLVSSPLVCRVITHACDEELSAAELRVFALDVLERLGTGLVCVFAPSGGRIGFVIVTRGLGLSAHRLVGTVAPYVAGKGGGTDEVAQGSGTDPGGVDAALEAIRTVVE